MPSSTLPGRALATLMRRAALSALSLPAPVRERIARRVRDRVDGNLLDPQARMLIALSSVTDPLRPYEVPIAKARRDMDRSAALLGTISPAMASVREIGLDAYGARLPARVYVPARRASDAAAPAILFFHGGGFALGGLDSHDPLARELAHEAGRTVIAVDYRLAPEHKFPTAVDDALGAFGRVHADARELRIDPAQIAVAGDSAGATLSAVVSQSLTRAGGPRPEAQVLIYPATDMTRSMPSHRLFGEGYMLEARSIDWFLASYLRSEADELDPRASPLFAERFDGLPRAMVITAGFDPLRDEGDAYAAKLQAAGVPTEHVRDLGMFHGYMNCTGALDVARGTVLRIARFLAVATR